jgi:FAD/FMN-containing dehydrogenase
VPSNRKDKTAWFKDLTKQIEGIVLDEGDEGYQSTINIDNSRVSLEPRLVVRPQHAKDVATVLKYCSGRNQIPLTAKSGGHSATGYCLNAEGIVLDLVRMSHIRYSKDKSHVVVGAGTRWIDIYNFLHEHHDKRIVVGGGCPGVGVSGFLLGGGFSFLSRSFGLGSDNVDGIEVVTARGTIHSIGSKSSGDEKDLFWAMQGGGGGNFGVATEFRLRLREVHHPLMVGQVVFPFYRIEEILDFYDRWIADTNFPDELAVYGMMRTFADPRNDGRPILTLRFTPIFNGPYQRGISALRKLTALKPITSVFHAMTLPEWENFIGSATKVAGNSAYIRSVAMAKNKMARAAQIHKRHMVRRPSQNSYIVWTHTGGQMRRKRRGAYPWRSGATVVEVKSLWDERSPRDTRKNVEWAHKYFEELGEHGMGAYINYIDPLLPNWQDAYYGRFWDRLCEVKEHWDPKGFFDFQQGIGSRFQPHVKRYPLDLSPLYRTK